MLIFGHYLATFVLELGFSVTSSTVMLNSMKQINNNIYNISEIISVILTTIIFIIISFDKYREWLNKYAIYIILLDFVSLFIIQVFSYFDLSIRYMLIAVIFPLFINLRETILYSKINLFLSGNDLTQFNVRNQAFKSIGRLIGYLTALFISLDLIWALLIQVIAIIPELLVSRLWILKRL